MNATRFPRFPVTSLGLLAAVAMASCGDGGHPPGATGEPWAEQEASRITFEHIGAACGDEVEHWQAVGGLVLRGGTIAVGDAGNGVLFCADGALVGRAGGGGDGPGEFKTMASNWVADGPRLAIPDIGLRRVTVFTDSGHFVRSISIRSWRPSDVAGVLPDGRVVILVSGPQEVAPVVAVGEPGRVDTLAAIRGPTEARISYPVETPKGPVTMVRLLGGCLPQVFSAVVGSEIYVVRGDSGVVHRVGEGGLERLYGTPTQPRVRRDDIEALQRMLRTAPADTLRAAVERYGSVGEISPVVWSRLIVDPVGRLWLGRGSCAEGYPSTFEVVDTSGVLVGWSRVPPMAFRAARGETALFTRADSLGVEYVEIFRVTYPGVGAHR